jgi:hypothetical protein
MTFRKTLLVSVALALIATSVPAQGLPRGVDLSGPAMTEAELSREEVAARLAAATPGMPADFSRLKLNGLDLGGLDFTGAN